MKQGQHAGSGSNVAVFEYVDLQGKLVYKVEMATGTGTGHADVKRIYTELDACTRCTGEMKKYFAGGAEGFYSFKLNDKGRKMWEIKIGELYKYLFPSKK